MGIEIYRSIPNHDPWPEFAVPWNDNTPGPTDMSFLLHKPAGSKGFIQNVDGHLATGDGARWRMWGLNICTDMPLPPMQYAPIVARRLAKCGCNCLRLHAIDHRWPNGILMRSQRGSRENRWWGGQDETTRALDPEALARLDYFIFCCKREGIYLDLNLNVARTFTLADGVKEAELVRWGKGLVYFDEQLIALQKEYAAQLLQHVNPFTGLCYGEEPAIALIELVNENSLLEFWEKGLLSGDSPEPERGHWYPIPASYVADLDRRWNAWLQARYPDRTTLAVAWEDLAVYEDPARGSVRRLRRDEFAGASAARFRDEAQFYLDLEIAFSREMKRYLRETLGAKQLILGTSDHNHSWSTLPMLEANATLDVMDGHFYWQHPRSRRPGYPWRHNDWWIANTPMVDEPDASVVAHCSRSAVRGKPYITSEVNEPFPNDHAAEFIPIIAAYGSLQDWDGILFYDYDGSWGTPYWLNEEWREPPRLMTFELGTDPVKWIQFAAGALMFLRGDVRAAHETVERAMPHHWVLESLRLEPKDNRHPFWIPDLPGHLALVHRTVITDFDAATLRPEAGAVSLPEERIVSDTGELLWENRPGDGRVVIDTPRHQAIIGRAGRRATRNMDLNLETPFAAAQLTSLGGLDVAHAERLLLVVGARVANTGMRWRDETHQTLDTAWGGPPTRIEPVAGRLTLKGLEEAKPAFDIEQMFV